MGDKRYVFASLAHVNDRAYTFHTDGFGSLWDACYHSHRALWLSAGWFQTYGDGMCQHSNEAAVQADDFADYCASLASFLLSAELSPDERSSIAYRWPSSPTERTIAFMASLRRGDKPMYFHRTDRKVSRSPAKQHDKRWEEVPTWADGSPQATFRLLRADAKGLSEVMEAYVVADAVAEWFYRQDVYGFHPAEELDLPLGSRGERNDARQAFDALKYTFESFRHAYNARGQLECYMSNTRAREKVAASEEKPAA